MQLYNLKEYTAFLAVLDNEIKQRQKLIEEVRSLFPHQPATTRKVRKPRKPLSKAARASIAEAQRQRWAKQKREAKAK